MCVAAGNLIIELSGAATAEPWNQLRDPNHQNPSANVQFTALVYDQSHAIQPNVPVEISVDAEVQSGGHHHTDNRPKGKLAETETGLANAPATISGVTDSNGVFSFWFGAEQAAGMHTLTATCTGCQGPATFQMNVRIPGLLRLGGDPECTESFCLRGGKLINGVLVADPKHPDNHYFEMHAFWVFWKLATKYKEEYDEQLLVNDSSLEKGGIYDFRKSWSTPHKGHRKGTVVDINNFPEQDTDFEDFVYKYADHAYAKWEVPPAAPHYHIRLLGEHRDE